MPVFHRSIALLAFGIVAALPAVAHAAWFSGIGDLAGGSFDSNAYAVSNDGRAAVVTTGEVIVEIPGYPPLVLDDERAARWSPPGVFEFLPTDVPYSIDISADGETVLGWKPVSSSGGGTYDTYLWTLAGGAVQVPITDLPRELSEDGTTIVGRGYNEAGGYQEAFRWSAAGGHEDLGTLPHTNPQSQAWGVSADGSVAAGTTRNYDNAPGFRWEDGVGMDSIGPLTEVPRAVRGVSGDGETVFGIEEGDSWLWTEAGGYVYLGNSFNVGIPKLILDVDHTAAKAVGGNFGASTSSAFLWDATNGMRELADILENDLGIDLTGWTLVQVNGISPNGLYVAGEAINPEGNREGFVAYLDPETGCGLGPELVPLAVPAWLRRQRRGRRTS